MSAALLAATLATASVPWSEDIGTLRIGLRGLLIPAIAHEQPIGKTRLGYGVDIGYRIRPWFITGGAFTVNSGGLDSNCHYEGRCLSGGVGAEGFAEVQAWPRSIAVPWARATVGSLGENGFLGADGGLDLRLWRVSLGGFVGYRAFAVGHTHFMTIGLRFTIDLGPFDRPDTDPPANWSAPSAP